MGKTNEENFNDYKERLSNRGELTPPPANLSIGELMDYLAKEGEKLLAAEPKTKTKVKKDDSTKLNRTLAISSKNPYVKARIMVLEHYPKWKRNEIETMEKSGEFNKFYDDFVKEVASLGDSLSP